MYKNHTKVSVLSLHHGNVFGDMEYSMYIMWATLQASFIPFSHTIMVSHTLHKAWSQTRDFSIIPKNTDIYIHTSFKIMFISFTTQSLASTRKHFFPFQDYTPAWKKLVSLHFAFPQQQNKLLLHCISTGKKLKCKVTFNFLYCELTPLSTFKVHC